MPLDDRLRHDLQRTAESIEPNTEASLERVTRRAGSRSTGSVVMVALAAMVVLIVFVTIIVPGRRPDGTGPGGFDGTRSPGPTARDATSILGSWSVTLTDADPGMASLGMTGAWTMRLGAGSTVDLVPPAGFRAPSGRAPDGYVHAENGSALLTTLFARDFAESCTGSGSYTWAIAGTQLSLTTLEDTCDVRRILLTTRPWSAQADTPP